MKVWLLLAAVLLAGCGSAPKNTRFSDAECMGLANTLQTLKLGDPLPRVQEVLGPPSRSYRVVSGLGRRGNILEYKTGNTPCASYLLDSPQKLVLQFDDFGRLIRYGRTGFVPIQGASTVSMGAIGRGR